MGALDFLDAHRCFVSFNLQRRSEQRRRDWVQ
jgi:hypothetical protein